MNIIYGTNNPAKFKGMKKRLSRLELNLLSLSSFDDKLVEPNETGVTPAENAKLKALGYYNQLLMPILAHDAGMYFEDVEERDQPGVFIKRIHGKDMGYDDLVSYYSELASKYGGRILAYYQSAICLVFDENHIYTLGGDSLKSDKFYIVDVPHEEYCDGSPLDSITVDAKTMKYYYDLAEEEKKDDNNIFDTSIIEFVERHLTEIKLVEN